LSVSKEQSSAEDMLAVDMLVAYVLLLVVVCCCVGVGQYKCCIIFLALETIADLLE
jgi:hypothetical protein